MDHDETQVQVRKKVLSTELTLVFNAGNLSDCPDLVTAIMLVIRCCWSLSVYVVTWSFCAVVPS